ncbi:MAG: hypothetical protein AAB969_02740 [Patescibacteria group bacterium]
MAQKTERSGLIYVVTIGLADVGVFNNFPDAFKKFWADIVKQIKEGTSWQVLETMNWITRISNTQLPILFYDARDLAFNIGLITPSDYPKTPPIVNEAPTINSWEEIVRERFISMFRNSAVAELNWANRNLSEIMASAKESGAGQEMIDYIQLIVDEIDKTSTQSSAEIDKILAKA